MITIFRRIRQRFFAEKNISRYILYATGEIILVVIGILIALQINNWNENRKAQIAQKDLLINFYENLEADSLILQENRWVMLSIIENHRQLQAVRKGEIRPAELANPESIRRSIRNYSITQTNHPDIAIAVFNKKLKEQIRQYYRLLAFLDNSNRKYDTVVRDFRPHMAANLALNPDYLFENEDPIGSEGPSDSILNLAKFYELIQSEEFGQILFESNLKAIETVDFFDQLLAANEALQRSVQAEIES